MSTAQRSPLLVGALQRDTWLKEHQSTASYSRSFKRQKHGQIEHPAQHSHEGSLCDKDVLRLAVLVDESRVGLHPLPALVLGQQAEHRQAALPRSHHCREEAHVQGPISTSPEAGLPPASLLFPTGISSRGTAERCPGWHMQRTPPWLDTPHCLPPRAPYGVTRASQQGVKQSILLDTVLKELPIGPASEVGTKGPEKRTLTSDVVLGTVQHVSSMDELVACATHP